VNLHIQQTLQQRGSPRLSFDSDELLIDVEDGLDDALAEGIDLELELANFEQELAEVEEPSKLDELELTDISMDLDIESPGSDLSGIYQLEDESITANNHTLLDAILPSWDESSKAPIDTFVESDADADILMGMLVMGIAEEALHMRGPYGQIPTSQDWFSVSMQWKGDRFQKIYRQRGLTWWEPVVFVVGYSQPAKLVFYPAMAVKEFV
ncbi:hypothetical protein RHS02_06108, partial [Rhizoctonia solani]